MNDIKKYIISNIVYAQAASDAGKDIYLLNIKPERPYNGYSEKLRYQVKAIQAIQKIPYSGINYYVEKDKDQNGYPSYIVYFSVKKGNHKFQVSFHNPVNRSWALEDYVNTGKFQHWRKNTQYSSRAVCKILAKEYNL